MRTARTLRTTAIAVVATAGISLGAASGAMAATGPQAPAGVSVSAESVAFSKAKKPKKAKTVKLRDGSTAKVYKLGKNKAKAVVLGPKGGTLIANGKNAYANHNGLHIKLTPGGSLTSWMDKAKPKPNPKPTPNKRVLIASPTLADGSTAKIYKLSASHYQADFFGAGAKLGSLDANGRAAYGQNNGLHVALQPDGQLKSWLDDAGQGAPDPQPQPDDDVRPDPEPTPDTDDIKPDPQPRPDEDTGTDTVKPDEQKPKPKPDVDPVKPGSDAVPAPVPAPLPAA
ncbi:hypothetical protein [Streptomyces sp. BA2]|uniref:hypothetical protein n=1 Tax=Streptomyces sp. BA2 TaxID=436595 RepID=UPI0013225A94|nr:hypothetical protein [Streptomyces sp. BA2]MWA10806.1 hypothetical protein [Streptomyces sp. BA2]